MIHFSKREDYGIILISELAKSYSKKVVPLSKIAKKHKIPLLFLRNIASDLRRSNLIDAQEGKNGGYKLKRSPALIQVGEIIKALSKGPLFSCCQDTKDGRCIADNCPHGLSLRRAHNHFIDKLTKITLDKLENNIW